MTIQELRDLLEGLDGDAEVRIATQPEWPFENAITAFAGDPETGTVWLGVEQGEYLDGAIADQLKNESGWGR